MSPQTSSPVVRRRSWQRGGAVLAVMAGLLVVAASTLAIRMARQVEDKTAQQQLTQVRMQRIQAALHAFAASQGRLPCPTDGTDVQDRGLAAPDAASVTCTSPDGPVPWRSLGMRADDALDAWGRKISYRVPIGANGLTLAVSGGSAGSQGLTVNGANNQAWVLVSHGRSGRGSWLPQGDRIGLPFSPDELSNTRALPSTIYVRREESVVDLDPEFAPNHFDDVLLFESIDDLKKWAGFGPGGGPVTGDVIKKLLEDPNAIDTKGNGSGLTAIDLVTSDLGTVRISSTGGEISTDGPYKTLGVCSSGCGAGNSSNRALDSTESLSFRLGTGKTAKSFALGLLGISNTTVAVSITFKKNGVALGNLIQSVTVTTAMPLSPQLTSLALTPPGTPFDEVVVQPVGSSRFFVANVFFCQMATCPSP